MSAAIHADVARIVRERVARAKRKQTTCGCNRYGFPHRYEPDLCDFEECPRCHGRGFAPGSWRTCGLCEGDGRLAREGAPHTSAQQYDDRGEPIGG